MAAADSSADPYHTAVNKSIFDGEYTTSSVIVTLSVALTLYNSLEMILLISSTFKRWKGLYFWSLSICNWGVMGFAIGMMLMYFDLCVLWLGKVVIDIGWVAMIVCQSLVLYSRLGLILDNARIERAVKWMIIIDSFLLIPIVLVFDFGTSYSGLSAFPEGYFYLEHVQMTVFTLQEVIISGLYVWKTISILKIVSKDNTRSMVWQLFVINVIIIAMDIALIVLQFRREQLYQEAIKSFVYSVKLKLELNILSKLVDLVHGSSVDRSMTLEVIDSNAIPGQAQKDVQRELSGQEYFGGLFASDKKGSAQGMEKSTVTERRPSSSTSPSSTDDNDAIMRIRSQQSRFSAGTSDRESDILYADMLRSMK